MGRFINADGIIGANQDMLGYNLYAYCSNNPAMYIDPSGHGILSVLKKVVTTIAKAVTKIVKNIIVIPVGSKSKSSTKTSVPIKPSFTIEAGGGSATGISAEVLGLGVSVSEYTSVLDVYKNGKFESNVVVQGADITVGIVGISLENNKLKTANIGPVKIGKDSIFIGIDADIRFLIAGTQAKIGWDFPIYISDLIYILNK